MNLSARMKISTLCLVFFHHFIYSINAYGMDKCPNYNPQNDIDIEYISGIWQGAEIITHFENRNGGGQSHKFFGCVTVTIEEVTSWVFDYDDKINVFDNPNYFRFLKLGWQEFSSFEYIFKFENTRRGFWMGSEAPIGSSLRRHPQHAHFVGTVQVMKAVGTHLVLTFCEQNNEIFTIILFREKNVKAQEVLDSVRNLLERRGLAAHSIRELCRINSSNKLSIHPILYLVNLGILFGFTLKFMK